MDMTIVCKGCGKSFSLPFRANKVGKINFCSTGCFAKTKQKTIECATCKKELTLPLSSQRKFCSHSCYAKSNLVGGEEKHVAVCEVCSKEFSITSTRKSTARFCSRECQSSSEAFRAECSERMSGDKHWRWDGGKYDQWDVYERYGPLGRAVHRKVLQDYMLKVEPNHPFFVEVSGVKKLSRHIHVHHIDRNPKNNILVNLLAVTIDAHAKIHHNNRKPDPWECWPSNPESW